MLKHISIGIFVLLTVVFFSCKKENSEPVMGNLQFVYDWGKLPADIKSGEGMLLRFYGEDGQIYDRESDTLFFCGSLPVGTYRVLLRNRPTPGIDFRNEDRFETAEAYVLPVSRAAELVEQPDWLFTAALENCEVSADRTSRLNVVPQPMVHRINFTIRITGGRQVENVTGRLLNVASTLNLSTGKPVMTSAGETAIPIERSGETFSGSVLIFTLLKREDSSPDNPDKNLRLDISYADETDQTVELDIYDKILDLGDKPGGDVQIEVNIGPGTVELSASVVEWEDIPGPGLPVK